MQWWWMNNESYTVDEPYPEEFEDHAGPHGLAVVKAYDDGSTTSGWGERSFMRNYRSSLFAPRIALYGYERGRNNLGIIMRSTRLLAIDIDGKNGGVEHAAQLLGNVPLTLAETSKSGNGYHLFFKYPDEWDSRGGFEKYRDAIGIVQGVDVKSIGVVYHYPQQRWNGAPIAELPKWIADKLDMRNQRRKESTRVIQETLATADELEVMMLHGELLEQLNQPIPAGKRNTTLFALGAQLHEAQVPDWEDSVYQRAIAVGLPDDEANRLVENIAKYGTNA